MSLEALLRWRSVVCTTYLVLEVQINASNGSRGSHGPYGSFGSFGSHGS